MEGRRNDTIDGIGIANNDIACQGFSLLTANREALLHADISTIARCYQRTIPLINYRFAIDIGMFPLSGTTNSIHRKDALEIADFYLVPDENYRIKNIMAG